MEIEKLEGKYVSPPTRDPTKGKKRVALRKNQYSEKRGGKEGDQILA